MKSPILSSLLRLAGIVAIGLFGISILFPLRVVPQNAPLDQFSASRALIHLPIVASQSHPSGSEAQHQVRAYLVQQLTDLGLEVDVQQGPGLENVVARLHGTDPNGAILLQAHYDSIHGPGAADNGSGVVTLLEIMRTLTASPALPNDVIAFFDDSEELPDAFTGTRTFIRSHPWMADVRLAIGMDTAVQGFISVNDTGPDNGWIVNVLASTYSGGAWTSLSGGGGYDIHPFRYAGVRILELEDNYPYYEKHTEADRPEIVNPASVQQLGDQALAVVRKTAAMDLSNTAGEQQTYLYIPYLALIHYPQTWALPVAVLAGVVMIVAWILSLRQKQVTWRGQGVAVLVTFLTAGVAGWLVNLFWKAAPSLFNWSTSSWPEWPEITPPYGWAILLTGYALVLVLMVFIYRFARRWSSPACYLFTGLFVYLVLAIALTQADPKGAILPTWTVFLASVIWLAASQVQRQGKTLSLPLAAFLASIPALLYLIPLVLSIYISDGTKSVAITSAALVPVLATILPGVDDLIMWSKTRIQDAA